jgi:hypothetical protein
MWYRQQERALHFQADLPVQETAWYAVRARTVGGRAWTSDALHYDAANDRSHVLSMVRLAGGDTEFVLQGYGEEMPLADIRQPFAGDHWWYPQGSYWQLQMRFGAQAEVLKGGDGQQAKRFRGRPSE